MELTGFSMDFTTLGCVRFVNRVCVGSLTQIWQGYNENLEIPVAIKLPVDELRNDKNITAMFRWEYSIGRDIQHPNIIRMYDLMFIDGQIFLTMEWFPHRGMKDILREGLETYAWRVPQMALGVAEAVAYFNSLGWVHRDLSPEVFMVNDQTCETKLIEFPFARHSQGFLARMVGAGYGMHGARNYISPEQIRGETVDQRSDLYSEACLLFEMAVGVPPYSGESFNQLVHQHLNFPIPSAETFNPNITPEFSKLLRQSMAKYPYERPGSTQDFLDALKEMKIFKRTPARK